MDDTIDFGKWIRKGYVPLWWVELDSPDRGHFNHPDAPVVSEAGGTAQLLIHVFEKGIKIHETALRQAAEQYETQQEEFISSVQIVRKHCFRTRTYEFNHPPLPLTVIQDGWSGFLDYVFERVAE